MLYRNIDLLKLVYSFIKLSYRSHFLKPPVFDIITNDNENQKQLLIAAL